MKMKDETKINMISLVFILFCLFLTDGEAGILRGMSIGMAIFFVAMLVLTAFWKEKANNWARKLAKTSLEMPIVAALGYYFFDMDPLSVGALLGPAVLIIVTGIVVVSTWKI